jgi:hypothetical protein
MDTAYVRSVYRRLWRAGHYAVLNRYPARKAIRTKLRYAFRNETQLPSPEEIENTERFLLAAGRRRGLENNVVNNLCHVHYNRAAIRLDQWVMLM